MLLCVTKVAAIETHLYYMQRLTLIKKKIKKGLDYTSSPRLNSYFKNSICATISVINIELNTDFPPINNTY